jgi:signal peptidase I
MDFGFWQRYREKLMHSRLEIARFLLLVLMLFAFRSAIADWNDVPTGSMEPTILPGDRIFVNKLAYDLKVPFTTERLLQWADPARGDIVVLFSPADGKRLVKRVIGAPGDTVAMRDSRLIVNGVPAVYTSPNESGNVGFAEPAEAEQITILESFDAFTHPLTLTPSRPAVRSFGPVVVPPDRYLVLGDNRDCSADSRFFGFVDRKKIVGKASTVVLSVDLENYFCPRLSRFLTTLS